MTNFTTRMMIAAATLAVAAGAASAQTLKAEIPFTFRANGRLMTAGTYRVTLNRAATGVPILYLLNHEGNRAAMAMARTPHDPPKAWKAAGSAVLSFECGAKLCSLVGLWRGDQEPAYSFAAPKPGNDEPTRVALIALRPGNSD
ncbi:conserved exported hypothetical protein [Candidatus Sulfopaludibacter sp. SbA6]|nr:conserved exported hypothetical protein [Candidatus Sulfopaludibacter sp. SbA6]